MHRATALLVLALVAGALAVGAAAAAPAEAPAATSGHGDATTTSTDTTATTPTTGTTDEPLPSATELVLADDHDRDLVDDCAAEPPEDFADPDGPAEETIGWFDGYWYNEPIDLDVEDGLTQAELEELSARTAARFEAMRCLPFESMPPVEIMSREEFANQTAESFAAVEDDERAFDNAQFETLLLAGSDEDSVEVREANRAATVGGFYNFQDEFIAVISDDPDQLLIDEEILAHELGHAVQDQHFDLGQYERDTHDLDVGKLGVIEGDVHLIEHDYLEYCEEGRWDDPCVTEPAPDEDDDPGEPESWGLYFMEFQPYSDGPTFVEHVYEEAGGDWAAVDALYDDMPRTALHVIYPEKFGEVEPVTDDLVVADESDEDFERLTDEDGPDHNVLGLSAMAGILVAPAYETAEDPDPQTIIEPTDFLNVVDPATGEIDDRNPLDYDQPEVSGWRGDRLYAYQDVTAEGEGADARTGTVWKLAFDGPENAERFAGAYIDLIEIRGGERDENHANVYAFDGEVGYDHAVAIDQQGDRLWIVTAPTVDELEAVHGDVELLDADEDYTPVDPGDDADEPDDTADDGADDDPIPGFGPAVALAAMLAALAVLARRG